MSAPKTIHSYDYINHPYETVKQVLSGDAQKVFSKATKAASSRVRSLTSELNVNLGGIEVSTDIVISIKNIEEKPQAISAPATTRLQLEWEAANKPKLFPFMKAELSIYPITSTETQLDFRGDYEPPLGLLGSGIDNAIMHRIAEASVHRFIQDLAAYLREELRTA